MGIDRNHQQPRRGYFAASPPRDGVTKIIAKSAIFMLRDTDKSSNVYPWAADNSPNRRNENGHLHRRDDE